jgi:diguanylate cyclase (GGDEF)-like protein/PAS domain S-box-containing protein
MPASRAEQVGGQMVQVSPIDGVRRIVAERRHPALPLTLRVGLGEAEVLEQHQRLKRELLIVGALLTAALLLANAHLLRLDRRLRQARLRAAAGEARLRNIIENIDAVTWEIELPSWRWTYVSPQAERLFGYPIVRWLDDPSFWIDHVHPDDREAAQQYRADCTARGEDHALEFRFRAGDGRELWLRDIVRVVRDSVGVPSRLTGVLVDISARVQSEQELRRERSLLHNLIDTIPDLIFVKDTEGVYRGTNSAFQHFVGRPGANLAGRTDHDLFDPLLADFFRGRDRMVLAAMLPQRNEEWVTYPDGRRVLLDTLKAPFQDDDGRPLGLIGVSRDITELKQNQDRLTLAKTVFDVTAEAIMVTDAEGRIVTVNPAFEAFTGLKQAQVLGSDGRLLRSPRQDDAFYTQLKAKLERRGRWDGELWMRRHDGSDFPAWLTAAESRDSNGQRTGWVFAFSDISRLKRQEQQIWQQANFDALTGLANRHQFQARLERALAQARRQKTTVGLMFIDLDHFKWINDSLGHEAGDAVLVEAGRRLRQCVREVDTVARLGGDEFTIVLEGMVGHEPLSAVADKVLHALSTPFVVQATEQHLSGSVGITVFPHDAADASTLLRFADIAMYRAKEAGRGRHAFYSPDMQRDMQARQKADDELRAALEHDGFVLLYQPVVELQTGRACAAEALLRLVDAEHGLREPGDFLAAAEDLGLMPAIGAWVVDAACAQWRRWADAGQPVLPIAVNIAAAQLRGPDLQEVLAAARQRHRVPVDQLTLDIGEALLVDPVPGAVERLHALQRSGVPIAVDRYGSGPVHATLALLQALQVRWLKVDRSLLVRCPGDDGARRLVAAIAGMAHSLDVRLIAVGVETAAQRDFLRGIGCACTQGRLDGGPVDAATFAARHLRPG